ncbi:hypothetical protein BD779DRAFT_1118664 [Infundibulicybe gibba]|nr:hypothetical protein BD779DRAFT_1118664 [Infundibulicybe gibba]
MPPFHNFPESQRTDPTPPTKSTFIARGGPQYGPPETQRDGGMGVLAHALRYSISAMVSTTNRAHQLQQTMSASFLLPPYTSSNPPPLILYRLYQQHRHHPPTSPAMVKQVSGYIPRPSTRSPWCPLSASSSPANPGICGGGPPGDGSPAREFGQRGKS